MDLVIIESPLAGKSPIEAERRAEVERNVLYARLAMLDSLRRGEAPYASHLLYTQVLDDTIVADRLVGITAGLAWGTVAAATVCYTDFGVSNGMKLGIEAALKAGRIIHERSFRVRHFLTEADLVLPWVRTILEVIEATGRTPG